MENYILNPMLVLDEDFDNGDRPIKSFIEKYSKLALFPRICFFASEDGLINSIIPIFYINVFIYAIILSFAMYNSWSIGYIYCTETKKLLTCKYVS